MSNNVQQCFSLMSAMSNNVQQCPTMSPEGNIEVFLMTMSIVLCPCTLFPCPLMSTHVPSCPPMSNNYFPHVRQCPTMSNNVQQCPPMSNHVQQCPTMSPEGNIEVFPMTMSIVPCPCTLFHVPHVPIPYVLCPMSHVPCPRGVPCLVAHVAHGPCPIP